MFSKDIFQRIFFALKLPYPSFKKVQALTRPGGGQVTVMAVCGVVAFFMADLPYFSDAALYPDTHLSSPYLPVILSMLAGYIVAESFFNVRCHRCPLTSHSPFKRKVLGAPSLDSRAW